jgi:cytoskeletal protein CcmA (bactofilin family)
MIWKREDVAESPDSEPVADARSGGGVMAEQGSEVTVVGAGAKLEGTIVSAGSLRVDGHVKGHIQADGDVMLSPQSSVEADIRAENLSVAGRFHGSIVVKGRAELARGGRIDGNITAKSLVIQEGGIFNGQSIMDQTAAAGVPSANAKAQASVSAQAQSPERTRVP